MADVCTLQRGSEPCSVWTKSLETWLVMTLLRKKMKSAKPQQQGCLSGLEMEGTFLSKWSHGRQSGFILSPQCYYGYITKDMWPEGIKVAQQKGQEPIQCSVHEAGYLSWSSVYFGVLKKHIPIPTTECLSRQVIKSFLVPRSFKEAASRKYNPHLVWVSWPYKMFQI